MTCRSPPASWLAWLTGGTRSPRISAGCPAEPNETLVVRLYHGCRSHDRVPRRRALDHVGRVARTRQVKLWPLMGIVPPWSFPELQRVGLSHRSDRHRGRIGSRQ